MKRVFLVGCPRSGTTLLQSMLAAHPSITSFPESHFFPIVLSRNRVARILGIASQKRQSKIDSYFVELGKTAGTVDRRLLLAHSIRDFVRVLDEIAQARNARVWIEKTPQHLHHIPVITRHIQDVRFIHLIRNGVDVVASMYRATQEYPDKWGGKRSIDQCIDRWIGDLHTSHSYIALATHHFVRYETLVDKPQTTLQDICSFLDLQFVEEMLTEHGKAAETLVLSWEEWKQNTKKGVIVQNGGQTFNAVFTTDEREYILQRLQQYDSRYLHDVFDL